MYDVIPPPLVYDLCAGTKAWSKPWKDHGYEVVAVDIRDGQDVRLLGPASRPVYAVLAAPVCTDLAACGARHWKAKGVDALFQALAVADACARFILLEDPAVWALEQPIGRLPSYFGAPRMYFQPYEYGDPYRKKTALWGRFNEPVKCPVEPQGVRHGQPDEWYSRRGGSSEKTKEYRSRTPAGFAKAFFEANRAPWWNAPNLED